MKILQMAATFCQFMNWMTATVSKNTVRVLGN